MPIPPRVTTLALVSATVLTAVGLNLAVMQRTADTGGSVTASSGAAATSGGEPATEQPAPATVTAAPSSEAPVGEGNGLPLDVAARFTQAPSAPSSSPPPSSAPPPVPSARPASAPATAQPPVPATQPATTAPSTTGGSSNTQPSATEYVTVEFDGVAEVVIAFHNRSTVEFWAAWPEPGWAYMVDEDRPSGVKVMFRPSDGGDEAELSIRPDDGELRVRKEY